MIWFGSILNDMYLTIFTYILGHVDINTKVKLGHLRKTALTGQ